MPSCSLTYQPKSPNDGIVVYLSAFVISRNSRVAGLVYKAWIPITNCMLYEMIRSAIAATQDLDCLRHDLPNQFKFPQLVLSQAGQETIHNSSSSFTAFSQLWWIRCLHSVPSSGNWTVQWFAQLFQYIQRQRRVESSLYDDKRCNSRCAS